MLFRSLGDVLPDEPTLADALLVCATETTTDEEIGRFAAAVAAELAAHDHAEPPRATAAAARDVVAAGTPDGSR